MTTIVVLVILGVIAAGVILAWMLEKIFGE